jgi:thiol-disulfide isomerase/thioredoxin
LTEKKPEKKSLRRNIIEVLIIAAVAGGLYFSGLHTEVIGRIQQVVLWTGLITPTIPENPGEGPILGGNELFMADTDGLVTSLDNYKGNVVFINFWATWCPPCIAEMPSIQKLYDTLSDDTRITFLLVSLDEDFETAIRFKERRGFTMPVYHIRNRDRSVFESQIIPTTYVVDPEGRIVLERRGMAAYDTPEFREFLLGLRS